MDITVITYVLYLGISAALTVWVAHTLHKNGRIFLVDAFHGNQALADSINHLLVVGFYLINIGFLVFWLREYGSGPQSTREVIEVLSTKVGSVILLLGGMHFFNMFVLNRWRKKAGVQTAHPPVQPSGHLKLPSNPYQVSVS